MDLLQLASRSLCCSCQDEEAQLGLGPDFTSVDKQPKLARLPPTPSGLGVASAVGDASTVQYLLRKKVDVNAAAGRDSQELLPTLDIIGMSPLSIAALFGHAPVAALLLEDESIKVNVGARDAHRETALMLASRHGHTEVVKRLLAHDATDANAVSAKGLSSLMLAVRHGHSEVVEALIMDWRVDIKRCLVTSHDETVTALTLAVTEGHASCLKTLVEHPKLGINERHSFPYGSDTALGCAMRSMRTDLMSILLQAKADPHLEAGSASLLAKVAMQTHNQLALMLLLRAAANAEPLEGISALQHAQLHGDVMELNKLIRECPAIVCSPSERAPPLHVATILGDIESVRTEVRNLRSRTEFEEARDGGEQLAAIYAFELGIEEIVRILLRDAHVLSDELVGAALRAVKQVKADQRGQRSLQAIIALLELASGAWQHADNICQLLRCFRGSMAALQLLESHPNELERLRTVCRNAVPKLRPKLQPETVTKFQHLCGTKLAGTKPVLESVLTCSGQPSATRPAGWEEETETVGLDFILLNGTTRMGLTAMSSAILSLAFNELFIDDLRRHLQVVTSDLGKKQAATFASLQRDWLLPSATLNAQAKPTEPLLVASFDTKDMQTAELLLDTLQARHPVISISPVQENDAGFDSGIALRFAYLPRVTIAEVFGKGSYNATIEELVAEDERGEMWLSYVNSLPGSHAWRWALHTIWTGALWPCQKPLSMLAELHILHSSQVATQKLWELTSKVAASDSPLELTRRFACTFEEVQAGSEESRIKAASLAATVRRQASK